MPVVSAPVRVLIVDDHDAVRRGIRSLLDYHSNFTVCGEAADGLEAIEKARLLHPDVVLVDISMPRMDGLEATKALREAFPETELIIISQNDSAFLASHTLSIGARAFIGKFNLGRDLIPTLESISAIHAAPDLQSPPSPLSAVRDWLAGGGKMGEMIRAKDWSRTPLGPRENWPPTLRTTVSLLLANRFPQLLWWGPQFIQLYNDAYVPIPGAKHPRSLGQSASECWPEIWHVLGPLIKTPYEGGPPTWIEDFELEIQRSNFIEETHFMVAYSPVPDDTAPNGIGGVLATVTEITEQIISLRRLRILRELGARATEAKTAEAACAIAAETLAKHPKDVPFALVYLLDSDGKRAHLAASAGIQEHDFAGGWLDLHSEPVNLCWPVAEALSSEQITLVNGITSRFDHVPSGPWSEPPRSAAIVPILSNKAHEIAGLLICGISSRLSFDSIYRDFFQLTAVQIATAIANARAIEYERKRSEALAELDRAKTAFFSNVSHEFRTPLTLILGPLEDALANAHGILPLGASKDLAVSHRNALRLLKLVNTLLDFARIEARRVQASYQPSNLAALTSELASNFRSACEKAGLKLIVNCPQLPEPVYVDREMWEKIVLNLLSNAFKFTHHGEIEVGLSASDGKAVLTVRDTGVGIPADELPKMFERFHRVKESRGRTHEGTGIGLALALELAKLHGGTAAVTSEFGKGSIFTVAVPLGTEHLDPQRIGKLSDLPSTSMSSSAYVEEALRWLPDSEQNDFSESSTSSRSRAQSPSQGSLSPARVLWADDNADMRAYVARLLGERFQVEAVPDGEAALNAIRTRPPDLVLADVMMPKLDGVGLLQALRADPRLREIPVILLSARAGEESRIEGIAAGADDYLTKPFSARELMARVEAHVQMSSMRRDARLALEASEERYRELSQLLDAQVRSRTAELEKRNADVLEKTEQLRQLSQRLLGIQENERRNVARELQDNAGNTLTALGLALANIGGAARRSHIDLENMVGECQHFLKQLASEIRTMSYVLHPPLLDEGGLPAAVRWYVNGLADRGGLQITVSIATAFPRLPPDMELAVFRIIQECLSNVHRHSGSKSVAVRLFCESGFIHLEVRDHGKGMSPDKLSEVKSQASGVGIRGMHERLRHFGGHLVITSDSRGTKISARIPAPVQSSLDPSLHVESHIAPTLPS